MWCLWNFCKLCNSQSSLIYDPKKNSLICSYLKGFEKWNRQKWTGGCVRRTPLQQCERYRNQNTNVDSKADGFYKLQCMVKVPDFADRSSLTLSSETCRSHCLENCCCVLHILMILTLVVCPGLGIKLTYNNSQMEDDLYFRVAHTELGK